MALEKLTGAVELLRALKDDKQDCDQEGQCRPGSRSDYLKRLRSFVAPWWFNMPIGASPIECARRGWRNVALDIIECECCGLQVTADQIRKAGSAARELIEGHSPFCPWRSHEVSLLDPSKLSDREVAEDIAQRLSVLKSSLRHYPVLVDDSTAEKTLKALALAGWEVDEHGNRYKEVQHLRCAYCVRSVAVQSFDHRLNPPASDGTEDVEGADESTERPSKAARREAPLPPKQDLWTPQPRIPAVGVPEADVANPFDQYACHRYFCPMYSRAGDDLRPFALRAVRVHDEASKPRGSGGAGVDGGMDDADLSVARAEELMRVVHSLVLVDY